MLREYHHWHSQALNREMELLVFGHAGARVLVFPTSEGRFWDWEDRKMIEALSRHIDNGWIQLYCVDSVDKESWFNHHADSHAQTHRHLQYQDYIVNDVLPWTLTRNSNPYTMAIGASFGAYHSMSIALRYPNSFNRVVAMSGVYDVREWTGGYMDDEVAQGSPCEYLARLHDGQHIADIKNVDLIIPIGDADPLYPNNQWMSQVLWDKGIWHALRVWRGFCHDWPDWHEMIQHYIGGPDSKD